MQLQKFKELAKKYMVRGLVWSVPTILTLWLASIVFGIADRIMGPVTRLLLGALPDALHVGPFANGESPLISFILFLLVLSLLGALVSARWGERIVRGVEGFIMKLPGVGFVYRNTRKMSEFFDGSKGTPFERVVMVPYPHPGIFTKAFVAGKTTVTVDGGAEQVFLKVVIPNPPTGVQGICLVPERDCIDLPMSVEEGIQFYVSLGMVSPERLDLKTKSN